jgi:hypothetical protein
MMEVLPPQTYDLDRQQWAQVLNAASLSMFFQVKH